MSLNTYVAELLRMPEHGERLGGEVLLARDHARRWAERNGRFDEVFAAHNPG